MKRERLLNDESEKKLYNAWDNVYMSDEQKEKALQKIKDDNLNIKYNNNEYKHSLESWENFYNRYSTKFFKDRKWIKIEFPQLFIEKQKILEIGCGVGNSLHELSNTKNEIYGCDFSEEAIKLAKERFSNVNFFAHDLTAENEIPYNNFDSIISVYVLSAIDPLFLPKIFLKLNRSLKPNGKIFFKDYGFLDMTQLRFKKDQTVDKNFYRRRDGTYSYFFDIESLKKIVEESGFFVESLEENRKLQVNRKKSIDMYRVMIQGIFVKR